MQTIYDLPLRGMYLWFDVCNDVCLCQVKNYKTDFSLTILRKTPHTRPLTMKPVNSNPVCVCVCGGIM